MAATVLTKAGLILVVVILASILGAVKRRERIPFVLGISLFIGAHFVTVGGAPVGTLLAVVGVALALASTVPLLRQPA